MGIETAIAIASVVAAAGSAASQADSSRRARNMAVDASKLADPAAPDREQYRNWLTANFPSMSSPDPNEILKNPNFQFMKDQGNLAITNANASTMGSRRNGTLLEDMSKFNTGLASGFINDQFQRNMSVMGLAADLGGFRVGAPGTAGQILATAGQNAVGNNSDMWNQIGGGLQLLRRGGTGGGTGLNQAFAGGSGNTGWSYDTGMGG